MFLSDAPAENRPRGERLDNKVIELEAEANGKKVKIKASSPQELEAAVKAIQELVKPDDNSISI
ncbi:hypothetical protein [Scytonema sp. PCC 10023]|uniref:hypothetical protein n=1 Tax=Scytonema sp. PCC 10023 TaxID=1680591 RepID=UPI0039C692F6